jgi:hypothetical protein
MADSVLELLRLEQDPASREVVSLADAVRGHSVFSQLRTLQHIRLFMEHHVWCVWDFMSLLKSIQAEVAPITVPWKVPEDCESARLVNEIVVGEEGDDGPDGAPISHFELYMRGMRAAGANTGAMDRFLEGMAAGASWSEALTRAEPPKASVNFVRTTLEIARASVPERVAAFTVGREEIIPGMFRSIVDEHSQNMLASGDGGDLSRFVWYLQRHIDVDGNRHGPMSSRLFERVCMKAPETRALALQTATRVLTRRLELWDAVKAATA